LIAWLPDLLISKGFTPGRAGLVLSLMQIIGLGGSFLAPLIAVKYKTQVRTSVGIGIAYLLGFMTLFMDNNLIIYCGMTVVGICLGASISLLYTLIGLRAEGATIARLSGMAQSAGYYLAALGPLAGGLLFDVFQDWNVLIVLLLGCSSGFIYLGTKAGRNIKV